MSIRAKLTNLRAIASNVGDRAKSAITYSRAVLEYRVGFFVNALGKFDSAFLSEVLNRAISKRLSDTSAITENISKTISKPQSDQFTVSDLPSVELGKAQEDNTALTDDETLSFGKNLSDSVGITDDVDGEASVLDDQEIDFFKVKRNSAFIGESFDRTVSYNRELTDLSAIAESKAFALTKVLSDSVIVGDTTFFTREVDKADAPGVTENSVFTFGKALSDSSILVDTQVISVGKPLSDSGFVAETEVKSTGKAASDTSAISSSGSLVSQSYCDITYFAEDYVGTSRTFT